MIRNWSVPKFFALLAAVFFIIVFAFDLGWAMQAAIGSITVAVIWDACFDD